MTPPSSGRTRAFISYSHLDRRHLERLQKHLAYYAQKGIIDFWDDTKIKPGSRWREDIKRTIDSAGVAILLVSADFLASEFITHDELPPLLAAAKEEGATILPVILSPCSFNHSELAQFHAVNPPSRPLIGMTRARQEALWASVAEFVKGALSRNITPNSQKSNNQPFVEKASEEDELIKAIFQEEVESQEPVSQKTVEEWLDDHYDDLVEEEEYKQFAFTEEVPDAPFRSLESWLKEAETYYVLEDSEAWLFASEQAIRQAPDNIRALFYKAEALSMLERHEEALAAYERVIQLAPTTLYSYYEKYRTLMELQRYKDAYNFCFQIRQEGLDREHLLDWLIREADALIAMEKYDLAVHHYRLVLSKGYPNSNADKWRLWKKLSDALLFMEKVEEGVRAYREATKYYSIYLKDEDIPF